jgi:hypothetical protein
MGEPDPEKSRLASPISPGSAGGWAGAKPSGAMVTRDPVPGPGQAVVGLSLKPSLLPDAELRAGSFVMVVRLAGYRPSPSDLLSERVPPTTGIASSSRRKRTRGAG